MIPNETYELCLPILENEEFDDETKTEKLEDLLAKETSYKGKELEALILDALWRYRDTNTTTPGPSRTTVVRSRSPAPWQLTRSTTPVQGSPRIAPPPGFGVAPPAFTRAKSGTHSPFASPRPSPRMAFSSPHIPHSPSLNAYEFSESVTTPDIYGDLGSDNVDWLVNDETGSNASSSYDVGAGLNGAAAEWVQPIDINMSPYDMLRSILGDERTEAEIEQTLEANGFDLSATLLALMGGEEYFQQQQKAELLPPEKTVLIGKSISPSFRPATPLGQQKSTVLCKYWLSTGHCARADCRFSHDSSKTVCKYWMHGNCLAGDTCMFSHDPAALVARLTMNNNSSPPVQDANFQLQDYSSFPSLAGAGSLDPNVYSSSYEQTPLEQLYGLKGAATPPPGLNPLATFTPRSMSRSASRPASRSASRAPTPSIPAVDDAEAFPTLGSAASNRMPKKHHGKRGHNHHHAPREPATLADLVKMSPSPSPSLRKASANVRTPRPGGSRENSAAAMAIPAPEHIPWLETGDAANKAYLKARAEAFRHGGLRNKFLQSAAQAWNRNDSRAAKALSLRGQAENNLMKELHREAARILYEERNKETGPNARELYVDLHGLHPEEAITYLLKILVSSTHKESDRPLYAITGTGHHSKNGRDKVGKAIRGFLNEYRYAFREFSVPGDRNNVGGILGVLPNSWDKTLGVPGQARRGSPEHEDGTGAEKGESTKIRIMKRGEADESQKGGNR